MHGVAKSIQLYRGTENGVTTTVGVISVLVVSVFVVAVLVSRAATLHRARTFLDIERSRRTGEDGVITGAESVLIEGAAAYKALLLHGFNDTPQSLLPMGRALQASGWSVSIPLLPHHGRGADVFLSRGNADAWMASARETWAAMNKPGCTTLLVGQSMGGAIASILAAEHPPAGLVLLAPYLGMGTAPRLLAPAWPLWQLLMPEIRSNPERAIHDPAVRAASLGGRRFSPRLVYELLRVVRAARRVLQKINVPTIVIHARADYRIPSVTAQEAFTKIGASDKTLVWTTRGGHVIAADEGRDEVIASVMEWLSARGMTPTHEMGNTLDAMRTD
jgi:carboxylesterase